MFVQNIKLAVFLGLISLSAADAQQEFDIYPYITVVSEGPAESIGDSAWTYYRLVITNVEIYDHLYIEKIVTDIEMYTRKMESSFHLDLGELINDISVRDIQIVRWINHRKALVAIDDILYRIEIHKDISKTILVKLE